MSLARLLTHHVTIKRPAAGVGIQRTYTNVYTAVPCLIQPLDPAAARQFDSSLAVQYQCFMAYAQDVRLGDQLVDQLSRTFYVKGLRVRNYGTVPHKQLLLAEDQGS